jgi:hypothetical protein
MPTFHLYQPTCVSEYLIAYVDTWFRSEKSAARFAKTDMGIMLADSNFNFIMKKERCSFWEWLFEIKPIQTDKG